MYNNRPLSSNSGKSPFVGGYAAANENSIPKAAPTSEQPWYKPSTASTSRPFAIANRKPISEGGSSSSSSGRREPHFFNAKLQLPVPDEDPGTSASESNWQYQIHTRAKQAWTGSVESLPKLKVNNDGTYMKHTPWSDGWLDARSRIKAWLEYQTM
jgi:hypothetical protein